MNKVKITSLLNMKAPSPSAIASLARLFNNKISVSDILLITSSMKHILCRQSLRAAGQAMDKGKVAERQSDYISLKE
jgi:hypothetical protein